jgi:hypothetical protein
MSKPGHAMSLEGGLVERLPFRVGIASRAELADVARMRAAAYGRHLPELGQRLAQPEPADFEWGCEVIVATSKLDGTVLGTLRTHANVLKPLPLEESIDLPAHFQGKRLVEATRLSVLGGGQSSLVRNSLFKAFYLYSVAQNADCLVVAGRRPVDRIYDGLLYTDVAESGAFYPMAHAGGLPHRVMSMAVSEAEPIWRRAGHPLYRFAFEAQHSDIDLDEARDLTAVWELTKPRNPAGSGDHRGRLYQPLMPLRRVGAVALT